VLGLATRRRVFCLGFGPLSMTQPGDGLEKSLGSRDSAWRQRRLTVLPQNRMREPILSRLRLEGSENPRKRLSGEGRIIPLRRRARAVDPGLHHERRELRLYPGRQRCSPDRSAGGRYHFDNLADVCVLYEPTPIER
jgi:hypothetical protein